MGLSYRLSDRNNAGNHEIMLRWHSNKNGMNIDVMAGSRIFVSSKKVKVKVEGVEHDKEVWLAYVTGEKPHKSIAKLLDSDDLGTYHTDCRTQFTALNKYIVNAVNALKIRPSKHWLKDCVDGFYAPVKHRQTTLLEYIDEYLANLPNKQVHGNYIKNSSIKDQSRVKRKITNYAKYLNRNDFNFSEIDNDFVKKYREYLTKTCGHTKNNVGNCLKHLRTVLNAAFEAKLMPNRVKIEKMNESIDNIFLNENELGKIQALDLPKNLEQIRDFFIILAWTGCRISDLSALLNTPIDDDGYISIYQKKTNARVKIPILTPIMNLVEKYHGTEPKINSKFNSNIRRIAELAGITTEETISRTVGGQHITTISKKFELIGSHTARRSFSTNLYLLDCPTIEIMAVTGHKTEKAFLTYIKMTQKEHAERMKRRLDTHFAKINTSKRLSEIYDLT
jgi:integrase